jgi:hypothetical protein
MVPSSSIWPPLGSSALVVPTIAQAIGLTEVAGQSLVDRLADALAARHVLLLLDTRAFPRGSMPKSTCPARSESACDAVHGGKLIGQCRVESARNARNAW